jgi:hypothetical protein
VTDARGADAPRGPRGSGRRDGSPPPRIEPREGGEERAGWGEASGEQVVAALWLGVWQRIAGRSAHEVKNALNGVSVNLEVVRSRLARAAADPAAGASATATRFAEVASAQFELLAVLNDAMLGLARPARSPADVTQLLAPLVVLLDAIARAEGGSLIVGGLATGSATHVAASPLLVRLLLAAALDAAVGRGRAVTCRVETGREVRVRVAWDGLEPAPPLAPEIARAAAHGGVGFEAGAHAVTLTFVPAAVALPVAAGGNETRNSE